MQIGRLYWNELLFAEFDHELKRNTATRKAEIMQQRPFDLTNGAMTEIAVVASRQAIPTMQLQLLWLDTTVADDLPPAF